MIEKKLTIDFQMGWIDVTLDHFDSVEEVKFSELENMECNGVWSNHLIFDNNSKGGARIDFPTQDFMKMLLSLKDLTENNKSWWTHEPELRQDLANIFGIKLKKE